LLVTLLGVISCASDHSGGSAGVVPNAPAVTDTGVPTGVPVEAEIGSAGGQVVSGDGILIVVVPAGALAAPTKIGIQPITNLGPGGFGSGYRLTPEGQTFASPAQLVFGVSDADLAGSTLAAVRVEYQDAAKHWRSLRAIERDAATHRVTVTTTHFSDWVRAQDFSVDPKSASIEPGQAVSFTVTECGVDESPTDDELSRLVRTCVTSARQLVWSANAIPGGDATNGMVVGSPGHAIYTGPAGTPAQNPVAVSGQLTADDGTTFLLVSNVDVGGKGVWVGTASLQVDTRQGSTTSSSRIEAQVTWQWNEAAQTFRPQGNLAYDLTGAGPNAGCMTSAHHGAAIRFEDGQLVFQPDGTYFATGADYMAMVTTTSNCNDALESKTTTGPTVLAWLQATGAVSADGKTIEGTQTSPMGTGTATYTWKFTKQ